MVLIKLWICNYVKGLTMEISSNTANVISSIKTVKINFTQKITQDEAKDLREQISVNANAMMFKSTSVQTNIIDAQDLFTKNYEDFKKFLKDISYDGKPIADLSKEEASELISEDGIFGIKQTSQRIADFVINRADGNEDRLRAGREGMLQGFKMAEEMWGGELPDISQKTMARSLEILDKAMSELGFSIINEEA